MDALDTFRLMLDEYSSRILALTTPRAMHAVELSRTLGIPLAACYRRIRALRNAGVLREEGKALSVGGKLVATYRSCVESAHVLLQDGRLRVVVSANGVEKTEEIPLAEEPAMLHWRRPDKPSGA